MKFEIVDGGFVDIVNRVAEGEELYFVSLTRKDPTPTYRGTSKTDDKYGAALHTYNDNSSDKLFDSKLTGFVKFFTTCVNTCNIAKIKELADDPDNTLIKIISDEVA